MTCDQYEFELVANHLQTIFYGYSCQLSALIQTRYSMVGQIMITLWNPSATPPPKRNIQRPVHVLIIPSPVASAATTHATRLKAVPIAGTQKTWLSSEKTPLSKNKPSLAEGFSVVDNPLFVRGRSPSPTERKSPAKNFTSWCIILTLPAHSPKEISTFKE